MAWSRKITARKRKKHITGNISFVWSTIENGGGGREMLETKSKATRTLVSISSCIVQGSNSEWKRHRRRRIKKWPPIGIPTWATAEPLSRVPFFSPETLPTLPLWLQCSRRGGCSSALPRPWRRKSTPASDSIAATGLHGHVTSQIGCLAIFPALLVTTGKQSFPETTRSKIIHMYLYLRAYIYISFKHVYDRACIFQSWMPIPNKEV